jgi:hypothetical protein
MAKYPSECFHGLPEIGHRLKAVEAAAVARSFQRADLADALASQAALGDAVPDMQAIINRDVG